MGYAILQVGDSVISGIARKFLTYLACPVTSMGRPGSRPAVRAPARICAHRCCALWASHGLNTPLQAMCRLISRTTAAMCLLTCMYRGDAGVCTYSGRLAMWCFV